MAKRPERRGRPRARPPAGTLTMAQVARRYGVALGTVYKAVATQGLKHHHAPDGTKYIRPKDLREWLKFRSSKWGRKQEFHCSKLDQSGDTATMQAPKTLPSTEAQSSTTSTIKRRAYRVSETAEMFDVSRGKIHRLIRDGRLKSVKIDGTRWIPAEAIDELMKG